MKGRRKREEQEIRESNKRKSKRERESNKRYIECEKREGGQREVPGTCGKQYISCSPMNTNSCN